MSLYSVNLEHLTAEFPSDADAVRRLIEFLARYAGRRDVELTPARMLDASHPTSQRMLARILQRLIEEGVLEEIVRVESEGHGGIGDLHSISEIPAMLHDWRNGMDVEVRPENLRLIYKV